MEFANIELWRTERKRSLSRCYSTIPAPDSEICIKQKKENEDIQYSTCHVRNTKSTKLHNPLQSRTSALAIPWKSIAQSRLVSGTTLHSLAVSSTSSLCSVRELMGTGQLSWSSPCVLHVTQSIIKRIDQLWYLLYAHTFHALLRPWSRSNIFLRNVCWFSTNYAVLYRRTQNSSWPLLWNLLSYIE
jgi:hypothetical protein